MQVYGIRSVVVPSLFRRGFVQNAPPRSHLGRNAHPVTPTLPGTCAPDLLLLKRLERAGRRAAEDRKTVARPSDRERDRKSTRLNSSHLVISYAVFCLKK